MNAYLTYESFLRVVFTLSSEDSAKSSAKALQGLAFKSNGLFRSQTMGSIPVFIYRKGHTIFALNVKAAGPFKDLHNLVPPHFPILFPYISPGTSWTVCHSRTTTSLIRLVCSFLLSFPLCLCKLSRLSWPSCESMFLHGFHATPTVEMHKYVLN